MTEGRIPEECFSLGSPVPPSALPKKLTAVRREEKIIGYCSGKLMAMILFNPSKNSNGARTNQQPAVTVSI